MSSLCPWCGETKEILAVCPACDQMPKDVPAIAKSLLFGSINQTGKDQIRRMIQKGNDPLQIAQVKLKYSEFAAMITDGAGNLDHEKVAKLCKVNGDVVAPQKTERIPCPYCNELIIPTAKKCRFCNEWLEGSNTDSNEPAVRPESQNQNMCIQCKRVYEPQDRTCAYCDAPLSFHIKVKPKPEGKQWSSSLHILLLVLTVPVAALGWVFASLGMLKLGNRRQANSLFIASMLGTSLFLYNILLVKGISLGVFIVIVASNIFMTGIIWTLALQKERVFRKIAVVMSFIMLAGGTLFVVLGVLLPILGTMR